MKKQADISKNDLVHTGTIATAGLGTGFAAAKIMNRFPKIKASTKGTAALIGGLGLIGDYGAVKLNKHLNLDKQASENKYLQKIAQFNMEIK